ncbi:hypothetical protein LCGC14_3069990, partial [marine sediment metagenome]
MSGFFTSDQLSTTPVIPRCSSCGLRYKCNSPNMEFTGEGKRRVLIVAEAPGRDEDQEGTQLVGKAGKKLRGILKSIGVDLDRDCWKTNALTCWPGEGNPKPTDKQISYCRANLLRTIQELEPVTIILLGGTAVKSLIGYVWKEAVGKIGRWVGWQIPDRRFNAWICPTWHPSYLLRQDDKVLELWFRRHLKAAFEKEGKPYENEIDLKYVPDVFIEHDPKTIVRLVDDFIRINKPLTFDYETTSIKPEGDWAEIVCCSFSDGEDTFAFPWQGEAIPAMGRLLKSRVPKIAWNLKMEDRWTRKEFGHAVRNWLW